MNRTIRNRWVKALRSGKYLQTEGILRRASRGKYSYCCLGVLADIIHPSKWKATGVNTGVGFNDKYLGGTFLKKIGLSEHQQSKLTWINDAGANFREIARYITRNL